MKQMKMNVVKDMKVSYDEFCSLIVRDRKNCRNFKMFSFEYYECGAMGFGWCTVVFKSLSDLVLYWIYCLRMRWCSSVGRAADL